MDRVLILRLMMLAAGAVGVFAVSAGAQPVTEQEIQGIDERYAIASKRVGEDTVQLSSRQDNDNGSTYHVHTFSCIDETFEVVFEGDIAPETLPDAGDKAEYQALEQNSEQRALAAHACAEHGFPALRMEW